MIVVKNIMMVIWMVRFHKIKNRVYATNQLELGAKMSLYYNMKMYCGDISVHGKYKFNKVRLND